MLRKFIYSIGKLLRNSDIDKNLAFLKASERWSIEKLQEHQLTRLKALVVNACENSAYYIEKYSRAGFDPQSVKSLADIKKIPPITKDEILENASSIQIRKGEEKLFYSETSGSTGKPLVFYRSKEWDAWHRASIFRGYSWYGVDPSERNGYLWGYNIALKRRIKTKVLDGLQNRFRLFSYQDDEIDEFMRKLSMASFLSGYSSMIFEVAKRVNMARNKPEFRLKMVKGTSEKIFDSYQGEVKRAFGRKMISEYGAAEAGIIAFECPYGNMHVNMETVIVEEENSEIIVTNLVSDSFPIIRYRLGDYIKLDIGTKCQCGMRHHIVKDILGRVGKVIYGEKKQYPSLTLYYVFKNLAMEHDILINYQAIQRRKGHLDLNVEAKLPAESKRLLMKEFSKYFENDLSVNIHEGADLKSSKKKKADFISEL